MLTVVVALIKKNNQILLGKRLKGENENKWEFPGGKVENFETDMQAIEREIKEELDIVVKAKEFIINTIFIHGEEEIDLRLYSCDYVSGNITLNDHKEIVWVSKERLLDYDLSPADMELAKYVQKRVTD